jgi:hypothetical protein
MLTILLTATQIAACAYVLYICIMVLNSMSKATRHMVRWSYLALSGGAFAGIISEPSWPACMLAIGVAVYLTCEERKGDASQRKSLS